jgi:glucan-binding YG repeat protein
MKKYVSKSNISINVVLEGGTNIHVAFTPQTLTGSVFYTDDEKLQAAIERHYKFGTAIKEEPIEETATPKKTTATKKQTVKKVQSESEATPEETTAEADDTEAAEATELAEEGEAETDEEETPEDGLKVVSVTDLSSAKDYLASNFGISRTKLNSTAKIKAAATANGIVFEGI